MPSVRGGSPGAFKSEKFTVRIENMKRGRYSGSPPATSRTKRRRRGGSPSGRARRAAGTPPGSPSRRSRRDGNGRFRDSRDRSRSTYRMFKAVGEAAVDESVVERWYRGEYRDFDGRTDYLIVGSSEYAGDAERCEPPGISLYDKTASVAPVYSSDRHYGPRARQRRSRSPRSFSPDYDRYRRRISSVPREVRRPRPSDWFYGLLPYGALPSALPPREFGATVMPPIYPREILIPRGLRAAPIHPQFVSINRRPLYEPPIHSMSPLRPHTRPRATRDQNHDRQARILPHYMRHVPPEDDPSATRTLFVGNLDMSMSDVELEGIFSRYGVIEDIDVKRPICEKRNAYAFVRYQNLDMAYRAKVKLSGRYLGKLECKIGYGKSMPTQRIWIGGLGPWTSLAQLERELDRFGVIEKIEYVKGDTCAYIQYENIVAATVAVKELKGVALEGTKHKLRTDFADRAVCGSPTVNSKSFHDDNAAITGDLLELSRLDEHPNGWPDDDEYPFSSKSYRIDSSEYGEKNADFDNYNYGQSLEQHSVSNIGSPGSLERSPLYQLIDSGVESEEGAVQSSGPLASVRTLGDLARKCTDIWQGSLVLESSKKFPTICHLTSGNPKLIESTMKDEDGKSTLHIKQRLHLNEPKLKDVSKSIITADMHAVFLAMPCSNNLIVNDDALVQICPLRNLILYLKQKKAAGVISLVGKDSEPTGVVYVFPPCRYSANLLKQSAKNLTNKTLEDDHLVLAVVIGSVS